MKKTDVRRAMLHPYQQTKKTRKYLDNTRPRCVKCRTNSGQADGFCKQCWYPEIEEDWQRYQVLLSDGYGEETAKLESGVWSYEELFHER